MLRLLAQRGPGFLEPRDPQQEEAGPSTQKATPGTSRDFSKIPLFAPGTVEPFQVPSYFSAPRLPIQAKLKVGAVNDPLEHEADRLAGQVMRMPQLAVSISSAQPKLRAAATGDPLERGRAAPSPDSFRGRGDPLPAPARGFFEQRLDYDFGGVRVHHGPDASESALSLGARAYTYGRDIVFGAGEYSPGSGQAKQLLAHELAHVVQQGAGHALVQRSPLSDSVKDAWTAEPKIEALLARLSQDDVQKTQADAEVDNEIKLILADHPDELWVALRIRKGELGQTTGAFGPKPAGKAVPQSIKVSFFQGSTDRRALVIAGVHGTERQGVEVANDLIHDLQSQTPFFTTIIVPSLFPDNAIRAPGKRETRESGPTPTNRNFPPPSEDLAAAKATGGGTAIDERKRPILPENLLLLELMERFHPERIISIHGSSGAGSAGVFYDRRSLRPDEVQAARDWASEHTHIGRSPQQEDEAGGEARLLAVQKALFQQRLAQMSSQADATDRDLSLKAAAKIDTATAAIPNREGRGMSREKEKPETTAANQAARSAHPSIAGNIGPTGAIENATWSGSVPGGVSLGGYAPPRGMSVFTVEPPLNFNTADVKNKNKAEEEIAKANRELELQSYAGAVRTVLLGAP